MIADHFGHSFVLKWSKTNELIEYIWVKRVCRHATCTAAQRPVEFVSGNVSLPQISDNLSITQFNENILTCRLLNRHKSSRMESSQIERDMQSNC